MSRQEGHKEEDQESNPEPKPEDEPTLKEDIGYIASSSIGQVAGGSVTSGTSGNGVSGATPGGSNLSKGSSVPGMPSSSTDPSKLSPKSGGISSSLPSGGGNQQAGKKLGLPGSSSSPEKGKSRGLGSTSNKSSNLLGKSKSGTNKQNPLEDIFSQGQPKRGSTQRDNIFGKYTDSQGRKRWDSRGYTERIKDKIENKSGINPTDFVDPETKLALEGGMVGERHFRVKYRKKKQQALGAGLALLLIPMMVSFANVGNQTSTAMMGGQPGENCAGGAAGASGSGTSQSASNESGGGNVSPPSGGPGITANNTQLDGKQTEYAKQVIKAGKDNGVDPYGQAIAISVVQVESHFQVYANTKNPESMQAPHDAVGRDHDSVGIFQQRDHWGSTPERLDPYQSAVLFYKRLLSKDYQKMEFGSAAQSVQGSAFPMRYGKQEAFARDVVRQLSGQTAGSPGSGSAQQASNGESGGGTILCGGANAAMIDCPPTPWPDVEKGLSPDALLVMRCLHQQFPQQIKSYGGVGKRGNKSDHETGRAIDAMIPNWDTPEGKALGGQVSAWLQQNAPRLGIKYLIWDVKYWEPPNPPDKWDGYTNPQGNQNPTLMHKDHVHVSVFGNNATGMSGGGGPQDGKWQLPVPQGNYRHTSTFGWRENPTGSGSQGHNGNDMAAAKGTPISAATSGTIEMAGPSSGYGNLVRQTTPDGLVLYYGHMDSIAVKNGQNVNPGDPIGTVGSTGDSTGSHLHFEAREKGKPVDSFEILRNHGVNP